MVQEQYTGEEASYLSWLVGSNNHVTLIGVIAIGVIGYFSFLVSTRVKAFKKKWLRLLAFFTMHIARWSGLIAYGMGGIKAYVIPFFEERLKNVIVTDAFVESILFEHSSGFYLMVLVLPLLFVGFVLLFLMSEYSLNDKELNKAFFKFEYNGKWLQKFSRLEKKDSWPDVELGVSIKTEEMVTIPGFDRTLNSIIVGTIGTGKTAALALPMLNQDLHHMTRFINEFPKLSKRDDYLSKEVVGRHLNGITVIEPSNDLCQKTLKLVKAHGIPDEAITYINPLDPDTPGINPMRGPVDKVAEVFAQIIAGLNDSGSSGNFFFEQAQRNHLKQHIYLLKLHDPDREVTFGMLIDMYNNANLVRKMHVALNKTIPKDIDSIEDKQERNYWKIVQGVDEWFDLTIIPKMERGQMGDKKVLNERGDIQYTDAKDEEVKGLRNILNDLGSNPYIRNVLFGESEFDFDEHFAKGGVLLVNTAKGQLVDLARVLGKIVLMNLQNATFRRPNDVSPFHHILVDEAPDYFYDAFREFPVQSRKYKVILTTIMQTVAQLADQYGEMYMTTIIAGMRNRMVYGDVPAYDAKYFSELFGEKIVFEEGQSEMSVSPLQDNPQTRGGSSYSKVREQAMTSGEIMFQDAFNCAVKIVVDNQPLPVQQIKANFVPAEEFESALIQTNELPLNSWLSYRRGEIAVVGTQEEVKMIENVEGELIDVQHNVAREKKDALIAQSDSTLEVSEEIGRMAHDPRPTEKLPDSKKQQIIFDKENGDLEEPQIEMIDQRLSIKEPETVAVGAVKTTEPVTSTAPVDTPVSKPMIFKTYTATEKKAAVNIEKSVPISTWTPTKLGKAPEPVPEEKESSEHKKSTQQEPKTVSNIEQPPVKAAYVQSDITPKHDEVFAALQNGVKAETDGRTSKD